MDDQTKRELGEIRAQIATAEAGLDKAIGNAQLFAPAMDELIPKFVARAEGQDPTLSEQSRIMSGTVAMALGIATAVIRLNRLKADLEELAGE